MPTSTQPHSHPFIVGTFNTHPSAPYTPALYTLTFTPPNTLTIQSRVPATSAHSWLHLMPADTSKPDKPRNLYATSWAEPPSVVAYSVPSPDTFHVLGEAEVQSRSGYVTATSTTLYSAGGATGEVFALDPETGAFTNPSPSTSDKSSTTQNDGPVTNGAHHSSSPTALQTLSFVADLPQRDDGSTLDFGGLRHGAHSADLSPDNQALYIADIGRNCIWTYSISASGSLTLGEKHISPRPNDGPRHVWPHPNGKVVYCLQEHSCMVDCFALDASGTKLGWKQGVRIIPDPENETKYWADEVRTSLSDTKNPRYLYASTRGLKADTTGYVAVFALGEDGFVDESKGKKGLLDMYDTPTSGGWANAVQPGPTVDGVEYLTLTDSEEGLVLVLAWDGRKLSEAGRVKLRDGDGGAATAVWW